MTDERMPDERMPDERAPANERAEVKFGLGALFLIAVLLPLVGYVGSIGLAEAKRLGAPTIQVKIEGYDPRDLIRGHYLRYRLVVEAKENRDAPMYHVCAGSPEGGISPIIPHNGYEVPKACQYELPADFVQDDHRFYVQQDSALYLEKAVLEGRATITLRVLNKQEVAVEDLLIDGKPQK